MQSSYRRQFGPESIQELRKNIQSSHEDFLKEDDPDLKADALRYMSAYVMQFLYLVPHDKKFGFKETERVLHLSSMNISDFDPREGSVAFEFLAKYAHNLLSQPWRNDFRTIKLTSGFFCHNINSQLHNAHEILVAMGYVHTDDVTLTLVPNWDEKRLKAVSKDLFIASQECLILSQVWQRVADHEPDYPLTIGEVFEYRSKYLGDTDTICKTLLSDIRRRHHQAKLLNNAALQLHHPQKFVPIDQLIEYEGMDAKLSTKPEKELECVENVLKNTRILHKDIEEPTVDDPEHIYDPVYCETPRNNGNSGSDHKSYKTSNQHPSSNSSSYGTEYSSAFASNRKLNQQRYSLGNANYESRYGDSNRGTRDSSLSPMIPKTVSNFFPTSSSYQNPTERSSLSSLNSSTSGKVQSRQSSSGGSGYPSSAIMNQPLKFSKVAPTVDAEHHWVHTDTQRVQPRESKILNWTEFSGSVPSSYSASNNSHPPDTSRKYLHEIQNNNTRPVDQGDLGRSRKPIMPGPGDIYPDDFFPRVVKPTAIHSLPAVHRYKGQEQPSKFPHHSSQEEDEDVLHEALAYASEVNGIGQRGSGPGTINSNSNYGGGGGKGGWETDTRSFSSENSRLSSEREATESKSYSSSTEISPWAEEGTIQRKKGASEPQGMYSSGGGNQNHYEAYPRKSSQPQQPSSSTHDRFTHLECSPESLDKAAGIRQFLDNSEQYSAVSYQTVDSSSNPSPQSPVISSIINKPLYHPPPNLQSLDDVYFNELLQKGDRGAEILKEFIGQQQSSFNSKAERTSNKSQPSTSTDTEVANYRRSSTTSAAESSRSPYTSGDSKSLERSSKRNQQSLSRKHEGQGHSSPNGGYNVSSSSLERRKHPVESAEPSSIPPVVLTVCEPWSCRFCTFRNKSAPNICEVCAKSKDFYAEEEEELPPPKLYSQPHPPEILPVLSEELTKECPQCTLLNKINRNVCEACDHRFRPRDSPFLM